MSSPHRPVTVRDIAAASGFSIATVSLALRDHPRISAPTRKKIATAAKRLGYRPNPMMAAHWTTVRARRAPVFQTVIAVLNDWQGLPTWKQSPWAAPIYEAFRQRAEALGYLTEEFDVSASENEQRLARIRATARVLRSRGVLGFAVLFAAHPNLFTESAAHFEDLAGVFIHAGYRGSGNLLHGMRRLPFHRTNADAYGNMLLLLDHLERAGYQRPGFWPNQWAEIRTGGESAAAFNFWIQSLPVKHRIPVGWQNWRVDRPLEESRKSFLTWLERHRPDTVICQNFEVRSWIESAGLKIPRDIGLAHPDLGRPEKGWSGVDLRHGAIAAAAVDLLTAHLNRNERGLPEVPKDVRIEGVWVQGTTTRQAS